MSVACLILCAGLAVLMTGCGASGGSNNYAPAYQATTAASTAMNAAMEINARMDNEADYDGNDAFGFTVSEDAVLGVSYESASTAKNKDPAEDGSLGGGDGGSGSEPDKTREQEQEQERKEIKNISCELVVKDVQAAYIYIAQTVSGLGGYEFSKTESKRDGNIYYSVIIKLPPENLAAFEAALRSVEGENALRYYNLYSDDITASYYDVASRLASMKNSLNQYYSLISKAVSVKDMLEIQREITILQAEIESLQGQMNVWNALVRHATINLSISKEADPLASAKNEQWSFNTPSEIINSMGNGFIATGNVMYQIIVGLFVVIVSLLPALIPLAIIVIIVIMVRRKSKPKRLSAKLLKQQKGRGKGNSAVSSDTAEIKKNISEAQQFMDTARQYMDVDQTPSAPGPDTRKDNDS